MDMVGHQAIGVDFINVASTVAGEPFEISPVVGIIKEGLLSLVTADDDVVQESGTKHSGSASHDMGL
jgi:hypothetical protein